MTTKQDLHSIVELLRIRAAARPSTIACTFLAEGEPEAHLTYGELDQRARAVAAALQERVAAGERALLIYPPGLELVCAFLGCLYAGVVAVPAYPPRSVRGLPRVRQLLADARPAIVLAAAGLRRGAVLARAPELLALPWLEIDALPAELAGAWRDPQSGPRDLAFLQYTSGSTAAPKGVMVSHGNLLANERAIARAFAQSEDSVVVGWLPLYHDMGLIGNLLQPLFSGARTVLMSPLAFLQRPVRWLAAIDRYRATTSGGPNFAYDLCARRISAEEKAGLDLSSWRVAFCGAEPVRAETLERFAEAFSPCGFDRRAFLPCYGLAESTLFVSGGRVGGGASLLAIAGEALEEGVARQVPAGTAGAALRVGCGYPGEGQEIAIVDPQTGLRCPPGRVGEIWTAGESVAQGYYGHPESTAATFRATLADGSPGFYLRTGDLGFLAGGELFVTGRQKDLVILRGRNHYPQDIELTALASHDALRPEAAAAFGLDVLGEERLVVVAEIERRREGEARAALAALRRAVALEHEVAVYDAVVVRTGTIPLTTSGKVRRGACRDAYRAGELAVLAASLTGGEAGGEAEAPTSTAPTPAVLAALPPAARRQALEEYLGASAARLLRVEVAEIERGRPLLHAGLDSLAAVELQARIAAATGRTPSLARLLGGASLAEVVDEALAGAPVAAPPSRLQDGAALPLSHGQRALWYLERLAPEEGLYNIAATARIVGGFDAPALARALAPLVERHPALRTTLADGAERPVGRLHAGMVVALGEHEAAGAGDADAARWLAHRAYAPFDLGRGPLLRLDSLLLADGERFLLLAVHHAVADFWSMGILARELGLLYAQETGEAPAAVLPSLPQGYGDEVDRREEWLAGPAGEEAWRYWRHHLAGRTAPLDLPTDRARSPLQTWRGRGLAVRLGGGLLAELAAFARRGEATLYMALLAFFDVLLYRHSGQESFTVGSPTAGRSAPGAAGVIGYFANPVVLLADLTGAPTLATHVARVRQTALAAFEHGDFPFPLLVERLEAARDASRSPLFQAMFVLQRAGLADDPALAAFALGIAGVRLAVGGLEIESFPLAERRARFDLTLSAAQLGGELGLALEFNSDLWDEPSATRLLGHLHALLSAGVADPARPVSALPLLAAAERHQILVEWGRGGVPAGAGETLVGLWRRQARQTPDATALEADEGCLTHSELSRRALLLARQLVRLGVGPEVTVGLFGERRPALLVGLLAILEAGGAYVPLDPAYPAERLSFILEDSAAPLLLADRQPPGLPAGMRVLGLDLPLPGGAADADRPAAAAPRAQPGNLAYVIYTSGSTGRPKGVAIEHRAAAVLVRWAQEAFGCDELAGVLASTSICFDLSIFEIFVPLASGGRVILAPDGLALPSLAAAAAVTLVNTVPSVMAELVRAGALPAGVRSVNLAGEVLSAPLAREIFEVSRVERLRNLYGPSEDTTYSTWEEMRRPGGAVPTLGRPLAGTWAGVLSPALEPLPAGAAGELFLAGTGLARGYLGRPDLTAERFLPDPWGGEPGARSYRTGDLARFRADGRLELLGRADHQIKLRGFRIELGEIEAALRLHPAVREAAVVLARGAAGEGELVAFVAAAGTVAAAELAASVASRLPGYMVPAIATPLPALPLLPNGKIDRQALVRRAQESLAAARSAAPSGRPATPTEELLAGVWAEVLGRPGVGPEEDFFALGGHSLLAARATARAGALLGIDLPLAALLAAPTVRRLAAWIEARTRTAPPAPPLVPGRGPWPLSFEQEELWALVRHDPAAHLAYNVPVALTLAGPLHDTALAAALDAVVRRHAVLRSRIVLGPGGLEQVPVDLVPAGLPTVDLAGLPPSRREEESRRLAVAERRLPFDLARGPLLRACLLRRSPTAHVLLLSAHHIATDDGSAEVFLGELAELYDAARAGRPPRLAALPAQYGDYAAWQRRRLAGEELARLEAFWRDRLAGSPAALELATDRPRPPVRGFAGRELAFRWPDEVAAGLAALARRSGATLFMALLALFDGLLLRYTGQTDLVVGAPVANRGRAELFDLIGLFAHFVALRGDLSGEPSLRELLARLRGVVIAAFAHQELSFGRVLEALDRPRDRSRSPLFDTAIQLLDAPAGRWRLADLEAEPLPLPLDSAKLDLVLVFTRTGEALGGSIKHSTELFDPPTIERLLGHLLHLATAAVEHPDLPLTALPLLGAAERHQIEVEGRAAAATTAGPLPLSRLFERRARAAPDATALAFAGARLSYGELNRRANRLARFLEASGVGPETRVGLLGERSAELVVALLAILKAGGTYLPIDPSYPRERAALMLEDAAAPLLLAVGEVGAAGLLDAGGAVIDLARLEGELAGLPDGDLAGAPAAEALAYVIYTSGSTGRPKGVGVEHRQVTRLFDVTRGADGLGDGGTWTFFHSHAFDFSVWEIWGALLGGGTLVVVPYRVSRSPQEMLALLAEERATVLSQTPSAFRQLSRAAEAAALPPRELALCAVVFGGEALEPALVASWLARFGETSPRLINMYGITETTVHVTFRALGKDDLAAPARSPIGRPLADLTARVLAPGLAAAPLGVPGELFVGGAGVARGYLGRPELTAWRFLPDPWGEAPGARLYRTGDRARLLAGGELEYLGRLDQQVKIRGFRIELGEIEAALAAIPGIAEALVMVREDAPGDRRLVAYLVGDAALHTAAGLRAALAHTLPEPMLPADYVVLAEMPLTPHGKVDRRALPAPGAAGMRRQASVVPPRTPLERAVAVLWGEVLHLEEVSVSEDFFAAGGNSIAAAVLVNRLQEALGEIVHVVAVFDAPTVADLAAYLERTCSPAAIGRLAGDLPTAAPGLAALEPVAPVVAAADLARLRRLVPPAPRLVPSAAGKGRRAVFILSPPRSGSTLLRVMLAGHPDLFAPPELELLGFSTLAERRDAFQGRDSFWLEGALRAVMDLEHCDAAAAAERMAALERGGATTADFYRFLEDRLGGRTLVDKTPSYALDPGVLERAEQLFEGALYVHLVRHPGAMIRSFEEAKLDQIFFRREHPFTTRELAELLWVAAQQNILRFLDGIPERRRHRVRFEDLVRGPEAVLADLCRFLEIPFDPAMARPYDGGGKRMTDGVHAQSRMLGDVKFLTHGKVDAAVADRWRGERAAVPLAEITWEVAVELGYFPEEGAAHPLLPAAAGEPPVLSFAQERLWFLDRLEPGGVAYNIAAALDLEGALDRPALAASFGEVAARHAVLRGTIADGGDGPRLSVRPPAAIPLPVVDLAALSGEGRATAVDRLTIEAAEQPFDLAAGPLIRTVLLRLGERRHRLLLALHHIAADGWSMGVLIREVAALYGAKAAGEAAALPPLPIQYSDYARWQRDLLRGPWLAGALEHWRRRLRGSLPTLLPADRPRSAVRSGRGETLEAALPPRLAGALAACARNRGATLYMALLAGFVALLARYTAEDEVTLGTPVAGRDRPEIEPLIGFFVNLVVLRGDLSGDPGFDAILGRVRAEALGAFAHQEIPFERVVEALGAGRQSGETPLFSILFALENAHAERPALPGLDVQLHGSYTRTTKYDLSVGARESDGALVLALEYSRDLFERTTILRLAGHFANLLAAAASDPGIRLGALPLLGDAELHQVRTEWNDSRRNLGEETAQRSVAARATELPDAVAVEAAGGSLSYGELEGRARRLAGRLVLEGVGRERTVGMLLERSADALVALLAIWQAGGACLPLDPSYPAPRLALLLADAGACCVLTDGAGSRRLPAGGPPVVPVDDLGVEGPTGGAAPGAGGGDLAYVLYTSGSTGRPKGVAVEQRSLANILAALGGRFAIDRRDRMLALAAFSFDIALGELLLPLVAGGTVVLLSRDEILDRRRLWQALFSATVVHAVPSLLRQLLDPRDLPPGPRPRPRAVWTGGERVPPELLADARQVFPEARVAVLYGPTEATLVSTCHAVPDGAEEIGNPIGRPFDNVVVRLAGRRGEEVPIGVVGEIEIGGAGVCRGYLETGGQGSRAFVERAGARFYRSGDLARRRPDGTLEFCGRLDRQVKIRGIRIEPEEIEAVLGEHPQVGEVAVVPHGAGGEARLVAYVAPSAGRPPAAGELRRHLLGRLPEAMVPALFVILDALPLTAHGKVDRSALPDPAGAEPDRQGGRAPAGPVEAALAEIWADLLGRKDIATDDDFFLSGGHSLLATRVVSRVRDILGVELPLRSLFERPTIAGLARLVDGGLGASAGGAIAPAPDDRPRPLSFAQERLWFLDQLHPGDPAYNLPVALTLEGTLSVPALAASLAHIAARHDALCTTFAVREGRPVQEVARPQAGPLPRVDLSALPHGRREAERLALAESRRPFDLARGPLWRAALLCLGDALHILLLTLHHAVGDGWSIEILGRELSALYGAALLGRRAALPALPIQYGDFAVWQRERLAGDRLAAQIAHWRERLAEPALAELPADRQRSAARARAGGRVHRAWPPELADGLAGLGRHERATLFMTLFAAFAAFLLRHAGEAGGQQGHRVQVGSPIAGRNRSEVEPLIGFFVNTLVLRADLSGDPGFREALARVRASVLEAYAHQELPFERLVAEIQPERSLARTPLFSILFALQNLSEVRLDLPGIAARRLEVDRGTAKLDLSWAITHEAGSLAAEVEYDAALFDRSTVLRSLERFTVLLAAVVADPARPISQLPLLGEAERHQLVVEGCDTAREFPRERSIPELFDRQARSRPQAPAVLFGEAVLTYGELGARANRLARRLVRLGTATGDLVGLFVERSVDLAVGMLGILKAGAAYVPLDPSYPPNRLSHMLGDAGCRVVVSQERLRGVLPETAGLHLAVLGEEEAESDAGPEIEVPALSLAYVTYTSGSTGRPKGIGVPHRAVVRLVLGTDYVALGVGDRVAQASNATFDAATFEIWGALLCGGVSVGIEREATLVPRTFAAVLRERRVDVLFLTTALFNQMALEEPGGFASLSTLLFGGEAVDPRRVRDILEGGAPRRLLHVYGPTECTTFSTWHPVEAVPAEAQSLPIGRGLANARIRVLDHAMNPLPVGVVGELFVGGDGLAEGYWYRVEQTAERFVPDPFGPAGERTYRTGDLVRWLASGTVEFVGRRDDQVKIRGFRIELGEIEAAILAHSQVRQTTVLVHTSQASLDRRLVAYVVYVAGAGPDAATGLRAHLSRTLPGYMVPAYLVALDELPLTPNGKVDRRALPSPLVAVAGPAWSAPQTPREKALAEIWAQVLEVEGFSIHDDFFALGGHSLLATRLVFRVREVFAVDLPLADLFELPTVAGLAARIGELAGDGIEPPAVPRIGRQGRLPLSFAQQRLWFLDQLEPGNAAYNIPMALRLEGTLELPALRATLAEIVRRHETLRTTFAAEGGEPHQQIAAAAQVPLPLVDLARLEAPRAGAEARRLATAEAMTPFDLAAGPLLRATLLRFGPAEHAALLTLHHIVGDAWSMEVLTREVGALYGSFVAGRPSPLPELAVQYVDFAHWQRQWLKGAVLERTLGHWKRHLAGRLPVLDLPFDRPRPPRPSWRGTKQRYALAPELHAALTGFARRSGTTLYTVLLTAFEAFLARLTGQEDVIVGTAVAGRARPETEGLIGFFVNMLPLRMDLSGNPSFGELLERVRAVVAGGFAHQDIPLDKLVEEIQPERRGAHVPLFQVAFGLRARSRETLELPGLSVSALEFDHETSRLDLSVWMAEGDAGLTATWLYDTDVLEGTTIHRWHERFARLLGQVAADPAVRLGDLELESEAEKAARQLEQDAARDSKTQKLKNVRRKALSAV